MSGYEGAYSGQYIPHKLRTLVHRMENYRVQQLKLQTESQNSAGAGERIIVNLPSSGLIDLSQLTMCGRYKGLTATGTLPMAGVSGLISRIDIEIGGQIVDSVSRYNELYTVLKTYASSKAHNRQQALGAAVAASGTNQGGQDLSAPYVNGTFGAIDATSTATVKTSQEAINQASAEYRAGQAVAAAAEVNFNLSTWVGFLGAGHVLQMDTLPAPVQIIITLDTGRVLGGAGTADFELNSLYFKVPAIEFPLLSNSIYALLDRSAVPVPFTRWVNFSFSNTAGALVANRFSIATGCLSRVWCNAVKQTNYAQAVAADGRDNLAFVSDCDSSTNWWIEVDSRRSSAYNVDQAREGYNWALSQLNVASDLEYENLVSGMGEHATATNADGNVADYGTHNFFNSAWLLPFNFSFGDYDDESHSNISGLNTNGLSSSIQINALSGYQSADHQMNVFCETKAVLNVMKNRVVSVDY